MPEGPSILIAREEMESAIGKKVLKVAGNSKVDIASLQGQKLEEIGTWGKHLLLFFTNQVVKIHFMMFGSYVINKPKKDRPIRMSLKFSKITIFFYSCSVKFLEEDIENLYDWSGDIMSPSWDAENALKKIKSQPKEMVCDVLMDQSIFSGVGNIIKNEVLFKLRLQPKRLVGSLSPKKQKDLVKEAHRYTWQF
jgi:endonuclease-8